MILTVILSVLAAIIYIAIAVFVAGIAYEDCYEPSNMMFSAEGKFTTIVYASAWPISIPISIAYVIIGLTISLTIYAFTNFINLKPFTMIFSGGRRFSHMLNNTLRGK